MHKTAPLRDRGDPAPPDHGNKPGTVENTQSPSAATGVLDEKTGYLLRRAWHTWVRKRWPSLLWCLALMALVAATTGLYPQIIRYSFDTLGGGNLGAIWWIVGGIIVVTAFRGIVLYAQNVLANRIVFAMTVDIQKDVYAHLLSADFARMVQDAPGQLVSRLTNDINYVQSAALSTLNTAVRDMLTIIALVVAMFYLDWALSLIVLCLYPIAGFPVVSVGRRLRKNAKRTQRELGDMTQGLSESFSGARLIKTYGLEEYATGRTNAQFDEVFRLRMKAVRAKSSIDPMLEALGGIAVAGVLAFAAHRIAQGISSVGDFMGFITALLMAAQPIRGLGNLNAKVQEGLAAIQRVFSLLDEKPTIIDGPDARPLALTAGSVRFENVSFSYGGDIPALREIDISLEGGRTMALVGRSGGGKSTLVNLVPRLFDPQSGRILVDGQDIRHVTVASLRSQIAIVSQDITLFNDTVRANIALGRLDASESEIVSAAQAAAAHEFISALPEGYDTMIGDRGMRLSGGQRQRLALARAILRDAPILLLDEATSALDTESERLVQKALGDFSRGRTSLVIAHRLSTVVDADLICVVEDGRIVERGSHRDLLEKNGRYAQLCESQLLDARQDET